MFILKYFLINIFLNISNYLIFLIFLFNSKKKRRKTKIIFFFIFFFISLSFLQHNIYQKFTSTDHNPKLPANLVYDIMIFGGNDKDRIPIVLNLQNNYKIDKVLYINSHYKVESNFFNLLEKKNLMVSELSRNTIEDLLILKKYKDKLNKNIIFVTDDFHTRRIKMIINNKLNNKNIYFQSVIKPFDLINDPYNFSKGLEIYSLILKEKIKILKIYSLILKEKIKILINNII